MSKGELFKMLKIYQKYKDECQRLEMLIRKFDKNKDMRIDRAELRMMLEV